MSKTNTQLWQKIKELEWLVKLQIKTIEKIQNENEKFKNENEILKYELGEANKYFLGW